MSWSHRTHNSDAWWCKYLHVANMLTLSNDASQMFDDWRFTWFCCCCSEENETNSKHVSRFQATRNTCALINFGLFETLFIQFRYSWISSVSIRKSPLFEGGRETVSWKVNWKSTQSFLSVYSKEALRIKLSIKLKTLHKFESGSWSFPLINIKTKRISSKCLMTFLPTLVRRKPKLFVFY